jgi:hypothetical protein
VSPGQLGGVAVLFANERDAPAVDAQPRMEVHSWRLIRVPSGELHLVTLRDLTDERGTVRVTSAIAAFDSSERVVTTSSGRQYVLTQPPEARQFERDLLQGGAVRLGMGDAVDVSMLVWDQLDVG